MDPSVVSEAITGYPSRILSACGNIFPSKEDPPLSFWMIFLSLINSFIGILIIARIDKVFEMEDTDLIMIVGSFGAQATLIFAAPHSHLAQPWNCIMGNAVSSAIGVSVYKVMQTMTFFSIFPSRWR